MCYLYFTNDNIGAKLTDVKQILIILITNNNNINIIYYQTPKTKRDPGRPAEDLSQSHIASTVLLKAPCCL